MTVYFLTEGGKGFGFGHIIRCVSIYQACIKNGFDAKILVHTDGCMDHLLLGAHFCVERWYDDYERVLKVFKDEDVVFIDSYQAPLELYHLVRSKVKNLICIDDNKRLDYPEGVVLNSTFYAKELNYNETSRQRYLLGERYAPLRENFWSFPQKEIRKEIKTILISCGGGIDSRSIDTIQECCREYCDVDFYIVDPSKKCFSADDMFKFMLDADICISGGGQTTYELACVGVPTIGICFADNQVRNLKMMEKKEIVKDIGNFQSKSFYERLKMALSDLSSYSERQRCSQVGLSYVDGQGSLRIVKEVLCE